MTEVKMKQVFDVYSVSIKGHAGYADIGKDIVCSACSILIYSLDKYLSDMEQQDKVIVLEATADNGNVNIVFEIKDTNVLYGINAIKGGFELLAENYSEYVKIF